MKKAFTNTDGFTVRRRGSEPMGQRKGLDNLGVPQQYLIDPADPKLPSAQQPTEPRRNMARAVNAQTAGFDLTLPEEKQADKVKKGFRLRKPSKKTVKWIVIALVLLLLAIGGFLVWKFIMNSGRVFSGNLFGAVFSNKPLKTDQYGRTNILVFGTSEDDPGHDGAELTDSIVVASIDQKKKDAFLFSVPRDLWVKYGQACNSGFEGKMNEVYLCHKEDVEGDNKAKEAAGSKALREKVGSTFGVDLQYSVHVNYTVVKQAVDALGGVDVTIESPDPRGIMDRNFDWRCKYKCYLVKHANGPAHLNGEQALFLAQARGEGQGYGLPRGNFDRETNQRKIMIAMRSKATSAGFLANPVAVTKLMDSLGENVRTNIDAEEIKSFVKATQEIDQNKIKSLDFYKEEKPMLTTGNTSGVSIVRPIPGLFDYSQLQAFIKAHLTGDSRILDEAAVVDVLNGSGTPGMAQKQADTLAGQGFKIGEIGNAPAATGKFKLYDLSGNKKPATKQKLEQSLGVTALATPPAGVTSEADFVIIIGSDGAN